MAEKIPKRYVSMAKMKCPNCHQGDMYSNGGIFPLKELMNMPERCKVCNQKFEIEVGFWYGTGYVSYAISVGLIFILAFLFAFIIGFSWKDNSVYLFLGLMIASLVLLQPWIMRYARVLYLYVFVKYGRGSSMREEK